MNVATSSIDTGNHQRVVLRYPDGGLGFEVYETLDGPPHWAPLEVGDLAADLAAMGWDLPDTSPPEGEGVEFMRINYEGLRAWVGGRRVSAVAVTEAMSRGMVKALRDAVEAHERAERLA